MRWLWWATAVSVVTLLFGSTLSLVYVAEHQHVTKRTAPAAAVRADLEAPPDSTPAEVVSTTTTAPAPSTTTTPTAPVATDIPTGPVHQAGCPPPPAPPSSGPPPWHPAVLVPDTALPEPAAPPTHKVKDLTALAGKGMWIWQWNKTEGGRVADVVDRAASAGLTTIWVRVGDTKAGFYGASLLDALVPAAHQHHLTVVAWGFPHLYDPTVDAQWTADVVHWRGPNGERVDAFSPDLEMASEGTAVSVKRLAVYLGMTRALLAGRPLVSTVYPPTDHWLANYPYSTVGAYSDATAPMEYWGCREPGGAAAEGVKNLAAYGPVLPIGQAYNMAADGGRRVTPSRAETLRFMDVAKKSGALGVSFWDWQEIGAEQWGALSSYRW